MSAVLETSGKQEAWLKCQLHKGMFSDELAVTFPPHGALQKSVFVSQSDVDGEPGTIGKVRVQVVSKEGGQIFAVLPSANRDIVTIKPEDITGQ